MKIYDNNIFSILFKNILPKIEILSKVRRPSQECIRPGRSLFINLSGHIHRDETMASYGGFAFSLILNLFIINSFRFIFRHTLIVFLKMVLFECQ